MMDYQEAFEKAQKIHQELLPYCERIEIAGSVRRQKPTNIKDIEIVCVQKTLSVFNLFGEQVSENGLLEMSIHNILHTWRAATIRNGPKWKTIVFPDATKLDLFIVTTSTWGTNFAIKTGPSDYSKWLVTEKRFGGAFPSYAKFTGSSFEISAHEKVLPMFEEKDFFEFLNIPMPAPSERAIPVRGIA